MMSFIFRLLTIWFFITTLSSCSLTYGGDTDDINSLQDSSNRDSTSVEYAEDAAWKSYVKGNNRKAIPRENTTNFSASAVLNSQEWEINKVNDLILATSLKDKTNGLSYTLSIKDCTTEKLSIGDTNLAQDGNLVLNINGKDIKLVVKDMVALTTSTLDQDYIIGQLLHNNKIIVKDESGKIVGAYSGKGFLIC